MYRQQSKVYTIKVFHPEIMETRIIQHASVFSSFGMNSFNNIKKLNNIETLVKNIRSLFNIDKSQKFFLTYRDVAGDEISCRTENDYYSAMRSADTPRLTIRLEKNEDTKEEEKDKSTAPSEIDEISSVFSESLQSIMKQLEQGISSLQASVEKSTTHTVDAVVKTAAETAANVYRSMLPAPTLSDKPQFDIICDGCYTPIRGKRWRCETCDDFDLCSACKSRVNHNPQHNFRFITSSSPSPQPKHQPQPPLNMNTHYEASGSCASSQSEPSQTIFICDYCDSDIVGIRHSCAVCPDFDLCHSCFSIVKENHPEHIFVTRLVATQACKKPKNNKKEAKKHNPSSFATTSAVVNTPQPSHDANHTHANVLHLGVYCDNCQAEITGTRFKCGHCANYDLCQICEEYAPKLHNKTHAFIKIRYPIKSLAKRPMLPTFSPLPITVTPTMNKIEQSPKEMKEVIHEASGSSSATSANTAIATTATAAISSNSSSSSSGNDDTVITVERVVESIKSTSSSASVISIPNSPSITETKDTNAPTAVNANEEQEEILSAAFVSDLNIPDGTNVVPNKTFIKMWKVVNNGNVDWPVGTHLLFNGGSILRPYPVTKPNVFTIPVTSPKQEACVSAELQAPDCPGEYSSYFCLCTADGVRFGDNLWCTIRVDLDEEPDHKSVHTTTTTPEDIMMNSSNSMIYPTASTTASLSSHEDTEQRQRQDSHHDEYIDNDDYSEFTSDHHSTFTAEAPTIRTDTDSHMSSPASSELDIGDHYHGDLFSTTEEEYEEESQVDEQVNYQVISPSASTTLPQESEAISATASVNEDDDFVIVEDEQEDEQTNEPKNEDDVSSSESNSLHSSVQTITNNAANTQPHTSNTQQTLHDATYYRSQLLQIHEMGFTSYDDLAISLLNLHDGNVDDVIARLLYYP